MTYEVVCKARLTGALGVPHQRFAVTVEAENEQGARMAAIDETYRRWPTRFEHVSPVNVEARCG